MTETLLGIENKDLYGYYCTLPGADQMAETLLGIETRLNIASCRACCAPIEWLKPF